jgi:lipopolysaccharide export system permease protein
MKTYIKFLTKLFLKSFFYIVFIFMSLVIILNLLTELDFFKDIAVSTFFPLFLSILNSPAVIYEMLPFVFLLSTQLFFINLLNNNEISIFKYSGLKNSKIISITIYVSFILGIIIITLFYNFSSNLKNYYLELKSVYSKDGKYLAVITKNGLWIKDKHIKKTFIINSSKIEKNLLIDNFITEFDDQFNVIRNIKSEKIDIKHKEWIIFKPIIYSNNDKEFLDKINISTNFDYERIQTLFSNLSSLSLFELIELRKNYIKLNYSTTELNIHLLKLVTYPLYLVLITVLSGIIMLNIKKYESSTLKISIGLFVSVIIYYINNFFNILGNAEKISLLASVFMPLLILMIVDILLIFKINDK